MSAVDRNVIWLYDLTRIGRYGQSLRHNHQHGRPIWNTWCVIMRGRYRLLVPGLRDTLAPRAFVLKKTLYSGQDVVVITFFKNSKSLPYRGDLYSMYICWRAYTVVISGCLGPSCGSSCFNEGLDGAWHFWYCHFSSPPPLALTWTLWVTYELMNRSITSSQNNFFK